MQTYEHWLAEIESQPTGRLWLLKFRYDINNSNIPKDVELTLQSFIESKLPAAPDSALQILDAVITENPKSFDMVGLRIPPNDTLYNLIVKLEDFALFYLDKPRVKKIDESNDPFDEVWNELGKTITAKHYDGDVKTGREFFWCAPEDTIKEIVTSCNPKSSLAATLRDRLGLNKMKKGQRLILINVPSKALAGKKLCAPTTLDSGLNPVFVPCNDPDGYGRTLNLKTCLRDVREVVVEKIHFDGTFGAERLGSINATVPSVSWAAIETLIQQ